MPHIFPQAWLLLFLTASVILISMAMWTHFLNPRFSKPKSFSTQIQLPNGINRTQKS